MADLNVSIHKKQGVLTITITKRKIVDVFLSEKGFYYFFSSKTVNN